MCSGLDGIESVQDTVRSFGSVFITEDLFSNLGLQTVF